MDGRPATGFVLIARGGEIVGGHDSCNGWGLSDQPGMIVIDAQECPPDAMRNAYWAIARGQGAAHTRQDGKLISRRGKHIGVFRRAGVCDRALDREASETAPTTSGADCHPPT